MLMLSHKDLKFLLLFQSVSVDKSLFLLHHSFSSTFFVPLPWGLIHLAVSVLSVRSVIHLS